MCRKGGCIMKYRKILALALSCVMAFSVAACGNSGGDKKEDTTQKEDSSQGGRQRKR